eukprot:6492257-Amphidinium_carterae.2
MPHAKGETGRPRTESGAPEPGPAPLERLSAALPKVLPVCASGHRANDMCNPTKAASVSNIVWWAESPRTASK